jgi:hypothetical protein
MVMNTSARVWAESASRMSLFSSRPRRVSYTVTKVLTTSVPANTLNSTGLMSSGEAPVVSRDMAPFTSSNPVIDRNTTMARAPSVSNFSCP